MCKRAVDVQRGIVRGGDPGRVVTAMGAKIVTCGNRGRAPKSAVGSELSARTGPRVIAWQPAATVYALDYVSGRDVGAALPKPGGCVAGGNSSDLDCRGA
jgi:hypothetical protein